MAGVSLEPGQTGAAPNQRKRKAPAEAEGEELESVEELEREVADLDRRILEHLRGTATRLSDTAVSRLSALRPPARLEVAVLSETSVAEDDQEREKVNILKSKIEANIADLPKVLEKINETIARCEKSTNLNVNFNPVFERKL
ncbi:unnamed protein product [Miscanthus lutarioriparius]|uniref:Uncharacterized protein n=1 Tax=Miscanthus lutarioriparius TaxID=422564 RepID=A0A811QNV0_9POAL|nr:unnamed protein product [Miscanthus lutarioriparius]